MNTQQIADRLIELHKAMVEKLGRQPTIDPLMFVSQRGKASISLYCGEGYDADAVYGDSFEECFEKAFARVAELPTPEARAVNEYISLLAKAVDHAKENNLPDEYVVLPRVAIQAMTENLITSQVAS
jgi:hypothetical protein